MEDSIFTQIIKGKIPAHKVYEDERTLAFMDIHPIQPGAVLVISKSQVDHVYDLPESDYIALMMTARRIGKALRHAYSDRARVGIIVEGFEVPHAHVKVVPVNSGQELRRLPDANMPPNHELLAEQARQISAAMLD